MISVKDSRKYTKIIVYELFGDQHDPREEKLLLGLFCMIFKDEMETERSKNKGMNSLFRSNNSITHLLSAYANRGMGLVQLKEILRDPLVDLISFKSSLNLKPSDIYKEIKNMRPEDKSQFSIRDSEAIKDEKVRQEQKARLNELVKRCEDIFQRITTNVNRIPYGIRWLCNQLLRLAREIFDASGVQLDKLIGGFLYLRFFNPVIINPSVVFVCETPSPIARNNLVLVAKVLQNLSNQRLLGRKGEPYLSICNDFIQKHQNDMKNYFREIVEVPDVEEKLVVRENLSRLAQIDGGKRQLTLEYSQVAFLHRKLVKNLVFVAPEEKDPLRDILKRLPKSVNISRTNTGTIQLRMHRFADVKRIKAVRRRKLPSLGGSLCEPQVEAQLVEICRLTTVALNSDAIHILDFIEEIQKNKIDPALGRRVKDWIESFTRFYSMSNAEHKVRQENSLKQMGDSLFWKIVKSHKIRSSRVPDLRRRTKEVSYALDMILSHQEDLKLLIMYYRSFLFSVEYGFGDGRGDRLSAIKNSRKKVFSLKILQDQKIVTSFTIPKGQAFEFQFKCMEPGRYIIKRCHAGFVGFLKKSISKAMKKQQVCAETIEMGQLLRRQRSGNPTVQIGGAEFNIKLLINLLHKSFGR
ncbi:hypothetical protein AAMO2058_000199500 [Amorphochlora amoebiformis]